MVKSYKLKDRMFLNTIPIQVETAQEKKQQPIPVHQFLIFDRSGSMGYYIDKILDVATDYVKTLPNGSKVSIGYFSSTGEYNLSVPYTLQKEISGAVKTIDSYRSTLGCTNFIEILEKVNETVKSTKTEDNALFFFTDGCHNSGGSVEQIKAVLEEWKKYAAVTMFVGYGYIDRDIMSQMASVTNGSFVHLPSFGDFGSTLSDFGAVSADTETGISVDLGYLPANTDIIAVTKSSIVEYSRDEQGCINFKPSKSGFKGVFTLTETPVSKSDIIDLSNLKDIDQISVERGIRAMAYIRSQKNDANKAMELLSVIGDKALIDGLYNSIAPDEFSSAEDLIRKSIFKPSCRYTSGKAFNYLPANDAFCVMDALRILALDDTVKMYVEDPDFEYDRIGSKATYIDGPKMIKEPNPAVNLNSIVMNEERLNISVNTDVKGTVQLDPALFKTGFTDADLQKFGIRKDYPVKQYRTYNIIADGRLNTKKLVLSDLSKETLKAIAPFSTKREDGKYVFSLASLPIMNRTYLQFTDALTLSQLIWEEKLLAEKVSVYKFIKKELELSAKVDFDKERSNFLAEKCYIKMGVYNQPSEVNKANDQYDAYFFNIKIKGFSSETTSSVIKNIRDKKSVTQRGKNIADIYLSYIAARNPDWSNTVELAHVTDLLAKTNAKLIVVRNKIQAGKMAIALINKGAMKEFSSRENMVLPQQVKMVDGSTVDTQFNFSIVKKPVII